MNLSHHYLMVILFLSYPFFQPKALASEKTPANKAQPNSANERYLEIDCGGGVMMKLVLIPAGKFMMGSPDNEKDRDPDEGPQHLVTISKPYYMGIYEVTQEQYVQVMGRGGKSIQRNYPVNPVLWSQGTDFCKKLSQKTGRKVRLPTEAEWEYACRAGSKTCFCYGDDYERLGDYAWDEKNRSGDTHPVGQKKPNDWGLYDMHGNVAEWCVDRYGEYSNANNTDPQGPAYGPDRVMRGAVHEADFTRAAPPRDLSAGGARGRWRI